MRVIKLTLQTGETFYVDSDGSPEHVAGLLRQVRRRGEDWRQVELTEMAAAMYQAIPATNRAAELFLPIE